MSLCLYLRSNNTLNTKIEDVGSGAEGCTCSFSLTWSFLWRPPCWLLIGLFLCGSVFLLLGGATSTMATRWDQKCWRGFRTWQRRIELNYSFSPTISMCFSLPLHHSSLSQTYSRFGILEAEAWCLRGRSSLCPHHQTPPSHCPPSPRHLVLLKHKTEQRIWVAGNVWGNVSTVRLLVCLAHLDGRIQGKGSENARSSRHTLVFLWSEWPQSGAARLTPREIIFS